MKGELNTFNEWVDNVVHKDLRTDSLLIKRLIYLLITQKQKNIICYIYRVRFDFTSIHCVDASFYINYNTL
jgi:hypothetical protein